MKPSPDHNMRTVANLYLLVIALLFISCSSKKFSFRKTYDVKTQPEQLLSQTAKPALQTYDSVIPVTITPAVFTPAFKESSIKEAALPMQVAEITKPQKHTVPAKRLHALNPLKKQVFQPSSETASAQKPAFIFSLILLLLVVLALVFVSLFVAVPFLVFFFALFLAIGLIILLLWLLVALLSA